LDDENHAAHDPLKAISAEQAQAIVLGACRPDPFVIQSCSLSPCGGYWVIRANTAECVLEGRWERCYVGVNAYLINTESGEQEIVGSGESVDDYLEDQCDVRVAADQYYVLGPDFESGDKVLTIRLHQKLGCGLQMALNMLSEPNRRWLTGTRRVLTHACALLEREGIPNTVTLQDNVGPAVALQHARFWPEVQAALRRIEPRIDTRQPKTP